MNSKLKEQGKGEGDGTWGERMSDGSLCDGGGNQGGLPLPGRNRKPFPRPREEAKRVRFRDVFFERASPVPGEGRRLMRGTRILCRKSRGEGVQSTRPLPDTVKRKGQLKEKKNGGNGWPWRYKITEVGLRSTTSRKQHLAASF